jgi:hypothetical protein
MNAPTGSVAIAPETFLHLTTTGWTAIGSIVGALSIVALAIFNLLYLRTASAAARAASEQAKAGIDAAEAARKQAEAAQETLRELQYQFRLQQIGQREAALSTLLEVGRNALSWREALHTERSLNDKAALMPANWPAVMDFVAQQVPAVLTEMIAVDRDISETERLLNEVVHVPLSMRSGQLTGHKISPLRDKLKKVADDAEKIAEILRNWRSH